MLVTFFADLYYTIITTSLPMVTNRLGYHGYHTLHHHTSTIYLKKNMRTHPKNHVCWCKTSMSQSCPNHFPIIYQSFPNHFPNISQSIPKHILKVFSKVSIKHISQSALCTARCSKDVSDAGGGEVYMVHMSAWGHTRDASLSVKAR